jgi:hypothetical protein
MRKTLIQYDLEDVKVTTTGKSANYNQKCNNSFTSRQKPQKQRHVSPRQQRHMTNKDKTVSDWLEHVSGDPVHLDPDRYVPDIHSNSSSSDEEEYNQHYKGMLSQHVRQNWQTVSQTVRSIC